MINKNHHAVKFTGIIFLDTTRWFVITSEADIYHVDGLFYFWLIWGAAVKTYKYKMSNV